MREKCINFLFVHRRLIVAVSIHAILALFCLGYAWARWETDHSRNWRFASAARTGDLRTVRIMLDEGIDPNAQNTHSHNALQSAVLYGHKEIVRLLLDKGANPNGALEFAAHQGNTAVLAMLMAKGPKLQGPEGAAVLGAAIEKGDLASVKLLLAQGVGVNTRDREGMTSLHHAASRGSWSIFTTLLAHGADIRQSTRRGMTPLMYAASTPTSNGTDHGDGARICRSLIQQGVDINAIDHEGKTALIYAVYFNRGTDSEAPSRAEKPLRQLAILLESGADVNIRDKYDNSALRYATEFRSAKQKALLREAGAHF